MERGKARIPLRSPAWTTGAADNHGGEHGGEGTLTRQPQYLASPTSLFNGHSSPRGSSSGQLCPYS